jgi:hypothetical protein
LAPGVDAVALPITLTNTGDQSVYVTDLSAFLTVEMAEGHAAGTCDASDYLINGVAAPGPLDTAADLNWDAVELATGGDSTNAAGNSIGFNDDENANQDACKGATVTIHYAAR